MTSENLYFWRKKFKTFFYFFSVAETRLIPLDIRIRLKYAKKGKSDN